MIKHEHRRAVRVYHTIIAIILLIGGGVILGFGVWMKVSGNKGPLNLNYTENNFFNIILSAEVSSIILGCFFLLTGVISLIALTQKCIGVTFRVMYVLFATIILSVLVLIIIVCFLMVNKSGSNDVHEFVSFAWQKTVKEEPEKVCDIEKRFMCRGFTDGDCNLCHTGVEPDCITVSAWCAQCTAPAQGDMHLGCYDKIIANIQGVLIPLAVVSGIVCGVLLVDILTTWLL